MKKWIKFTDDLWIPNAAWRSFAFSVQYFQKTKVLQLQDASRHFDDHACVQFRVKTMEDAEKILESVISVETI